MYTFFRELWNFIRKQWIWWKSLQPAEQAKIRGHVGSILTTWYVNGLDRQEGSRATNWIRKDTEWETVIIVVQICPPYLPLFLICTDIRGEKHPFISYKIMRLTFSNRILFFLIVPFITSFFSKAEDIIGCGGFVKLSPYIKKEDTNNLDFTTMTVSLYDLQDNLQYSVSCAPTGMSALASKYLIISLLITVLSFRNASCFR